MVEYVFTFLKPNEWRLVDRSVGSRDRGDLEAWSRDKTYGIIDVEAYKAELAQLK